MNHKHEFVFGLHPSSRGFGWVLFEGPLSPFDWGTADIRVNKNVRGLAELKRLFDKYQPRTLALEAFDDAHSRRASRIRKLYRMALREADARGLDIHVFSREQIHLTVAGGRARTREAIAAAVAEQLPILQPRLPAPRKIWVGEHPNNALFCAAACALAFYARERA